LLELPKQIKSAILIGNFIKWICRRIQIPAVSTASKENEKLTENNVPTGSHHGIPMAGLREGGSVKFET
jgi:hypothetical protein